MQTQTAEDRLLKIDELAARLGVHPVTARGLYRRGVIPGLKIGYRTLRFRWPDVMAALRKANDPAAPAGGEGGGGETRARQGARRTAGR